MTVGISEAPPFWWERPGWRAYALYPISAVYGAVARHRMASARREKIGLPVLCVGNFTVGGTGKTPVAIALAAEAIRRGLKPGFLSRGHGGSFSGAHIVDPFQDSARHVGDEPLLLATQGPVAVTPDRAVGARLLIERGCDFLIMDDGFQSARIHIDYALLVVDGRRGIGNGHVIPGGPMRAPLLAQLRLADALLKMGEGDAADAVIRRASRANKPVFEAVARPREAQEVAGRRFLAFAGIGHPEKFFDTVRAAGGDLVLTRAFPDHHAFVAEDIEELAQLAEKQGLELITTSKDAVRLSHGSTAEQAFLKRLVVLEIDVVFEDPRAPERIIADTLAAWKRRDHGPAS